MHILPLKFNNGNGALLCNCQKILAEGHYHANQFYTCKYCGAEWTITAPTEGGFHAHKEHWSA